MRPEVVLLVFTLQLSVVSAAPWFVPPPTTSFYWQLQGTINTSNPSLVFDIDGFSSSANLIALLHARGKRVICYFSFGSYESFRPDAKNFTNSVLGGKICMSQDDTGKCTAYWPGERWLDTRSSTVRKVMLERIKLAAAKKCDGIEPDNLDAYAANLLDPAGQPITRFTLTQGDAINYTTWIATTVHSYNMSVGLKNAPDIAPNVGKLYDWALNEQCNEYSDWSAGPWYAGKYACDYLNSFVKAGKAAFVAEYVESWGTTPTPFFPKKMCSDNNAHGLTSVEYSMNLDATPQFPQANCTQFASATTCAAKTWKYCVQPSVYSAFNSDPDMTDVDMIGQCERKYASQYCPYMGK